MARGHESRKGVSILAAVAALVGGPVLAGCAQGNEHGASKTDLDTMPSTPVAPMEPGPTTKASLPPKAKEVSQYVCNNSIFVDMSTGDAIIRPIINPDTGYPLQLEGIDAAGAEFGQPKPRGPEFMIYTIQGKPDGLQRLNGKRCPKQDVSVREIHSTSRPDEDSFVLVNQFRGVQEGDTLNLTPQNVVGKGIVHAEFSISNQAHLDQFLNQL